MKIIHIKYNPPSPPFTPQLQAKFEEAYEQTLEAFIEDDCSGDYKRMLLEICRGN